MAIREINLERIPAQDEVLTISKSGLGFGAVFIRSNGLNEMKAISFLAEDTDPYWLGFRFYKEPGRPNSRGCQIKVRLVDEHGRHRRI
jgi:hypothetical protein